MDIAHHSDVGTIAELLAVRAVERPTAAFVTCDATDYTFAELHRAAGQAAAGLYDHGAGPGDRVAIMTATRPELIELIFGVARLGAVQAPVNVYLKGAFLRHQLVNTGPVALVVDADGYRACLPLLAELPQLRVVVHLDGVPADADRSGAAQVGWAELVGTTSLPPEVAIAPADPAAVLYTSGTSGPSKGCLVSNGYYLRAARANTRIQGIGPDDVLYTAMPMFHAGAQFNSLLPALYNGVPVVIDSVFRARGVLARIRDTGATTLNFVGAMATALLATEPRPDDREHRVRVMMTAPLSPPLQQAVMDRFGIDAWTELYGQTECIPATSSPFTGSRDRASIGEPLDDLELALLDDDGNPVPDGTAGEMCLRAVGPFAMFDGYWSASGGLVPSVTAEDPWHHTGDLARRLPSGRLAFIDRKKDSLRRRGENISSGEVEQALLTHPKIIDAAVHAVPSAATEDDIKACLVLAPGESVSPAEMFVFFKENLPYFTIPRYVEVLDELPRNQVGRLQKFRLRENPLTDTTWDLEALGLTVSRAERRSVSPSLSAPARPAEGVV